MPPASMCHRFLLAAVSFLLVAGALADAAQPELEPRRRYRLEELIDIAERAHPQTRLAWELTVQRTADLGVARSALYPVLAALALSGSEHSINPFPKPLAPKGYTLVDAPHAEVALRLEYAVYDFGRRAGHLEAARLRRVAAESSFTRVAQSVAFRTAEAYYRLWTAEERLGAAGRILETAQTTLAAAEAQLASGRATLPDVLHARAARAQAVYDRAAAEGEDRIARVELREALGVTPSDAIAIEPPEQLPRLDAVQEPVADLVKEALRERADLAALLHQIEACEADRQVAGAAFRPVLSTFARAGGAALWPISNYGTLGHTAKPVWSAGFRLDWTLFDGGRRAQEMQLAESREREARIELREASDRTAREVWTAYVRFQTAERRSEAAATLLEAAETSYHAGLEAFQYGVKNLVDVVSAEKQLSEARLANVEARSEVLLSAASLQYATGALRADARAKRK